MLTPVSSEYCREQGPQKEQRRGEVGHSTSSLHSPKVNFLILCLTSGEKKKQIRYSRRNFLIYVSLIGTCIHRNLLIVKIKPPFLVLSTEESSHRAAERATSKHRKQNFLYTKGPGEMSNKHSSVQPQSCVPFQPQHVPRPGAKRDEERVPRDPSFLFPCIWARQNSSYQKLCFCIPPTHHCPKSASGIVNLVPLLKYKKRK